MWLLHHAKIVPIVCFLGLLIAASLCKFGRSGTTTIVPCSADGFGEQEKAEIAITQSIWCHNSNAYFNQEDVLSH